MNECARFRVWWIPQIPGKPFKYAVPDLKTARLLTDALARYDLFQYENHIKPDYSNAGGIQVWNVDESEWVDVEEDDEEVLE